MRILFSVILICLAAKVFSQSPCETFKNKEFEDTATFRSFINAFPTCGFDSIDVVILEPMLPSLIGLYLSKNISKKITYGDIIDSLKNLILTPEYRIARENFKPCFLLLRKAVVPENWKLDSTVLLNCGTPAEDVDSIYQQILSMRNKTEDLTYVQVMFAYSTKKKAQEEVEKNKKRTELHLFLCDTPKYASIFSSSYSLPLYYDYDQALSCAKKLNKPLFIDFNGWGCVNCRKMEKTVWQDSLVHDLMMKNFVLVSLYVDDRTPLPENEWKQSSALNKMIKTTGDRNFEIEFSKFNFSAQPHYCIVNPDGNQIGIPIGYCNKEDFKLFLQNALKEFQLKK